jgi:hypothetical protein
MPAIRGSTTRGGARALIGMIRLLRAGEDVGITPDGPKGPRLVVQQGCVIVASRSGAPIVPLAFECSSVKRLRSWDRFMIPRPFSRVIALAGEPIVVPPDLDETGIEEWTRRVQNALLALSNRAAEAVGVVAETADVDPLEASLKPAAPSGGTKDGSSAAPPGRTAGTAASGPGGSHEQQQPGGHRSVRGDLVRDRVPHRDEAARRR